MKIASPLESHTLLLIGPIAITTPVVTTWAIMAVLTIGGWAVTRRLTLHPSRTQAAFEMIVDTISGQIRETMDTAPARYLPLIGTIFLFVLVSNWSSLIPGVEPPTAALETDAALALIVFAATIFYGVRTIGPRRYLLTFAQPSIFMLPLNILELLTRSISLTIRLFGNVMSGVFIIAVVLGLAGLLVPIPLMALELLTGAVQAYIFCALAMVFIGGAIADAPDPQVPDRQAPDPQAKATS